MYTFIAGLEPNLHVPFLHVSDIFILLSGSVLDFETEFSVIFRATFLLTSLMVQDITRSRYY